MPKSLPTYELLRERLDYDPDDGLLFWRAGCGERRRTGPVGRRPASNGYLRIRIDGDLFFQHRVIWKWVFGEEPLADIDHRDRVRSNNRLGNLRDVSRGINLENQHVARSNSKTGVLGVSPTPSGKFVVHIRVDGKVVHLATVDTAAEGGLLYLSAKRVHHPEAFA